MFLKNLIDIIFNKNFYKKSFYFSFFKKYRIFVSDDASSLGTRRGHNIDG